MAHGEYVAATTHETINNFPPHVIDQLKIILKRKKAAEEEENRKKEERSRQAGIYYESLSIGSDYLEASGLRPTKEVIHRLYVNDLTDFSPKEILESDIFYDWDDYQKCVEQKHADDVDEKEQNKKSILAEINNGIESGLIPSLLATQIRRRKSDLRLKCSDFAVITSERASAEETIKRYARYMVANELVLDKAGRDTDALRLGIAAEMNLATSKILKHTFIYEVLGRNYKLKNKEDVTGTEIYQKWYDVLNPQERTRYLKAIKKAAKPSNHREYFYNQVENELVHIPLDGRSGNSIDSRNLIPLGEALLNNDIGINVAVKKRYNYGGWGKRHYEKAGLLLADVLDYYQEELDMHIWEQAARLGIVPGERALRKMYGGYLSFFNSLGLDKNQGRFKDWTEADFASRLSKIASEVGGVVTENIIWERIKNGSDDPSPRVMKQRTGKTFSRLLESAELPARNRDLTMDDCVLLGARYADENEGQPPNKRQLDSTWYLPSNLFIRKRFGSVNNYKDIVARYLEQREVFTKAA